MTDVQQQCVKYRIHGRVQGVGFRFNVWREAIRLGLTGYTRNLEDGSVEILACGTESQLNQLRHWLEEGGARGARIDNIFSAPHQLEEHWREFSVLY